VLNGAKEAALEAFIAGRIGFLAMADIVEHVMNELASLPAARAMDDVFKADRLARQHASERIGAIAAKV
jgi:1-deoxy-D-xylulose-5-phosphate reductoisomerase